MEQETTNAAAPRRGSGKAPAPRRSEKVTPPPLWKSFLLLLLKLGLVALCLWAALTYVVGVYRMSGNEMYPAVRDGDLCLTYRLDPLRSGDVVAYHRQDGSVSLARIVAHNGDVLDLDEGGMLINGAHPAEEIFYPTDLTELPFSLPLTLEQGSAFLLNDFRSARNDSRSFGPVAEAELEGKVILILRRRGF